MQRNSPGAPRPVVASRCILGRFADTQGMVYRSQFLISRGPNPVVFLNMVPPHARRPREVPLQKPPRQHHRRDIPIDGRVTPDVQCQRLKALPPETAEAAPGIRLSFVDSDATHHRLRSSQLPRHPMTSVAWSFRAHLPEHQHKNRRCQPSPRSPPQKPPRQHHLGGFTVTAEWQRLRVLPEATHGNQRERNSLPRSCPCGRCGDTAPLQRAEEQESA